MIMNLTVGEPDNSQKVQNEVPCTGSVTNLYEVEDDVNHLLDTNLT